MVERELDISQTLIKKSLFLFGPRQTGKTTYLKAKYPNATYINLLDTQLQIELLREPYRLREIIRAFEKDLVIIDEIEKVPNLLDEVQNIMQNEPAKRFILTGSSARKIKKAGMNLLGGRAKIIHFTSFVYPELKRANKNIRDAIQWGSLPKVLLLENSKEELLDYINVFLREEIKAEAIVRNLAQFSKFLELAATTVSEQIVYESLSSDVGTSAPTIKEYFQILEDTLIGERLYPYSKTVKRKNMIAPKFYFFDVGISNALLKRFSLHEKTPEYGKAFEAYLFHELKTFINFYRETCELYYWRSTDKHEVDFVIETEDNELVLIEIKASGKINKNDRSGINAFSEEKTLKISKKIIVCTESTKRITEDGLIIHPLKNFLEELWNGEII